MNTGVIALVTKRVGGALTKHSPKILTGIGIASIVATAITAKDAGIKANQILDERWEEIKQQDPNFEDFTKTEEFKETWKCYIPTAISAGISIACLLGVNSIHQKRNAALLGLYSISEAAFKEYKNRVIETIGDEKERVIRDQVTQATIKKNPHKNKDVTVTGNGEHLCYDVLSGRYFKSDVEHMRRAFNNINQKLISEMTMSVNEVYSELDLPGIGMGDVLGWDIDKGQIKPEFGSTLDDNDQPCIVLDFRRRPEPIR